MLEETIRDYRERRLSEKDYLTNIVDIASKVAKKDHGRELPTKFKGNEVAAAFFGILEPLIGSLSSNGRRDEAVDVSLALIDIIKRHHIVDVWSNVVAQNKMRDAIDDYFLTWSATRRASIFQLMRWTSLKPRSCASHARGFRHECVCRILDLRRHDH
jgi:hypothetical protein